MRDKLGQEITVGCYLAYGHALGRCAGLRTGKVLVLYEDVERDHEGKPRLGQVWKDGDCLRGVEVPVYRMTVIGVDDDWEGMYPLKLAQRTGTLQFPDRVVVLDPERVPQPYRDLLDAWKKPTKKALVSK
jgi:hypothetical protein